MANKPLFEPDKWGGARFNEKGFLAIYGGYWLTVPELLFEKKGLIPALQQLITSRL